MNHIQVGDEFRNLLLEKTAWEKIDLDVDITDSADQGADVLEEAGNSEDSLDEVQLTEEEGREVVVQAILDEAVENDVFFDLMERFATVFDSASHINENYEGYDEDDVVVAAIAEVFPEQFEVVDEDVDEE